MPQTAHAVTLRVALPRTGYLLAAVLLGVLVAGAAGVTIGKRPASYTSSTLLLVDQVKPSAASVDGGLIDKLERLREKYAGLVITDRIAMPVATALGLPISAVRGHISAKPVASTTLLAVDAVDGNAQRAVDLAASAGTALVKDTQTDQDQFGIPLDLQIKLSVVTPALAASKVATSGERRIALSLISGLIVAVLILALGVARRPDTPADSG